MLKSLADLRQIALFLAVGASIYFVYLGLFRIAKLWLPELPALSMAFVVAASAHFILNNWIVFANRQARSKVSFAKIMKFLVTVSVNYLVSITISLCLLQLGAPDYVALACGVAVSTIVNFLLSRLWVFS